MDCWTNCLTAMQCIHLMLETYATGMRALSQTLNRGYEFFIEE